MLTFWWVYGVLLDTPVQFYKTYTEIIECCEVTDIK